MSKYYVYVYIDPRNHEEFYYGKGTGSRMYAHLSDESDTKKVKQIKDIRKEGLEPIIRVIASNLSEEQAFLVEKTLIWKLGKSLTNEASGHFAGAFRPHNTLHRQIPGFDYQNDICLLNVGEGPTRCWEDSRTYGFISAGQDPKYSCQLDRLNVGDVVVAYLKSNFNGYVGVGRVTKKALPILDFRYEGQPLSSMTLKQPGIFENAGTMNSEFLVSIDWLKSVPSAQAQWKTGQNLYANQNIVSSMVNQTKSIEFVSAKFGLDLIRLVKEELLEAPKAA